MKKVVSIVTLIAFIIYLPINSCAGIVQEAEMILNATGKAKVASNAAKLGTAYRAPGFFEY